MARKWSYSTYGRNAIGLAITMPDIEGFVEKVTQAGKTLEEVAPQVITATVVSMLPDMKFGAERHRRTGDVMDAIEASPVQRDGDLFFAVAGIDLQRHPEAIEAVFQEYGDGHSPSFPDPFIRPALERGRKKFKALSNRYLKISQLVNSGASGKKTSSKSMFSDPGQQKAFDQLLKSNRIK